MRIDLNPNGPESLNESKRASSSAKSGSTNSEKAKSASSVSNEAGDRADLSSTHVNALAAQVDDLPEIRQEKVAALSAAIRDGSYDVTPHQTAEAMMSQMLGHAA